MLTAKINLHSGDRFNGSRSCNRSVCSVCEPFLSEYLEKIPVVTQVYLTKYLPRRLSSQASPGNQERAHHIRWRYGNPTRPFEELFDAMAETLNLSQRIMHTVTAARTRCIGIIAWWNLIHAACDAGSQKYSHIDKSGHKHKQVPLTKPWKRCRWLKTRNTFTCFSRTPNVHTKETTTSKVTGKNSLQERTLKKWDPFVAQQKHLV